MAIGVSGSTPQRSGEVYVNLLRAMFQDNLYAKTLAANISTTEFNGDINKAGDTVTIPTFSDVTVNPYLKGMDITYEEPATSKYNLVVDKAYYAAWMEDIVDMDFQKVESLMAKWSQSAADRTRIRIDTDLLGNIYTSIVAANKGNTAGAISGNVAMGATGAPVALNKTNVIDKIVQMEQLLDEQNISEDKALFAAVPQWVATLLKTSDVFVDASKSGDPLSTVRSGRIGQIGRINVYQSNLLANVVDGGQRCFHIIGGAVDSTAFFNKLLVNENNIPLEKKFAKGGRMLGVYGFKVVRPEGLVDLYAYQA